MNKYSDIINISYEKSAKRQRMTNIERAAQFSSFAALVGYEDAVEETARLTDAEIELSDTTIEVLNLKLQIINEHINECNEVSITYFVPDEKKEGGAYQTIKGIVKKIDDYSREIVMADGTHISIDVVREIDGEIFNKKEFIY